MKAYTKSMLEVFHWKYLYLLILMFSIAGLSLADWRYKLVFFFKPRAAIKATVGTMTVLLIGDLIGIEWRVFSTNQAFVSGLHIGSPNLPVEEILFLFLLSYVTLVFYQLIKRKLHA